MKTIIRVVLTVFTFFCLAVGPKGQAVVPAPDGGYPGFNTAEGQNALFSLTTGSANTAVGWYSLFSDTEGSFNTATGAGALLFNTTSNANTAFGAAALLFNTTGNQNTAVGAAALLNNTEGSDNTANGVNALLNNSTGHDNSATGFQALASNTVGINNTANGVSALFSNTEGNSNTANGVDALALNTTGDENTANGNSALFSNTEGNSNTANGVGALGSNTIGNFNTASGFQALAGNTTGGGNTALGTLAGTAVSTADNVTCIAHAGQNVSNTTWIGNVFGTTTVSGTTASVIVSNTGQLGTMSSSRRFKKEIKPMDKASEAILALKPVTFHYKNDAKDTPQFGLIAEEVAEMNPALVVRDKNGEIYTVRYDAVNAMLLNEFLKEHRKNEQQEATIAELREQIEALTAGLQKVSAQLEATKPAPQVVNNP